MLRGSKVWTHHGPLSESLTSCSDLSILQPPTGVFGRVRRFYAPLCTVVEWVPHSQVACGDRPIWAHLLLKRQTVPPQHSKGQGQSREMRTSKLNGKTLEAPDVPDVYRQRTCCADYQIGNNSGCFEALVAFWELLVLEGYFSYIPKDFSWANVCLKESGQLSCAEVMNVFRSNLDVKLDHRLLLRGGFYWFIIIARNNGRRCYACIDSSLSLSLETSMWELRHCSSLPFAVVRLHQFPTTIPFSPSI